MTSMRFVPIIGYIIAFRRHTVACRAVSAYHKRGAPAPDALMAATRDALDRTWVPFGVTMSFLGVVFVCAVIVASLAR